MLLGAWRAPWGARYGAALLFGGLALVFGGRASGARHEPAPVAVAQPRAAAAEARVPRAPALPAGPVVLEPVTIRPAAHPLDAYTPAELDQAAQRVARGAHTTPAAEALGSVAVGRPNRGRLLNAVELVSGEGLTVMAHGGHNFGTAATVRALREAAAEVKRAFPQGSDLLVGDISRARGGYLRPHRSHQLGVDADLGYFYLGAAKWYTKANAENLDRERTWAIVKALIATGLVEYIFMDRGVQKFVHDHALAIGEDPLWLETLFERPGKKDTLIRHTWGHATHFHVRFLDPVAEEAGRRLQSRLAPRRRKLK